MVGVSERPDIAIVGPRRVGTALGVAAARAGYRVVGVAGRDEGRARAAAERIGPNVAYGPAERIARGAALVLLTVSDDAIAGVCRQLAAAAVPAPGAVIAHCSGALGSEVLASARQLAGAAIGSMHPLQTFPDPEAGAERLAGAYFFCEGDDRAVAVLTALAEAVGGTAVRIDSQTKLLYHAAAVMACNCLTALLDAAFHTAHQAGIDPAMARVAFGPLIRATVDNVLAAGPAEALTGPIVRGDAALVGREAGELSAADGRLGEIYRALGAWTVDLAVRKGSIDADQARALLAALGGGETG